MGRRLLLILAIVPAVVLVTTSAAVACGGLVGENGTIQLTRTATLAAHHDGVERYVTSFEFSGQGAEVGSIIPLPAVPTKVERGGDWTLQRLAREVSPPRAFAATTAGDAAEFSKAQVILETTIDALDITILEGGSNAVGEWAVDHGFLLTPDAPEVLAFYAQRSPIFMAARFDATRARDLGQQSGDGTPIMLTIPTDEPWVPLRILALGQGKAKVVNADVYLLTDGRPELRTGGDGIELQRSERASRSLLDDLRSDTGMGWVPEQMWFTYLQVNAPARTLDYDLAVSTHAGVAPSARAVGFNFPGGPQLRETKDGNAALWWGALLAIAVVGTFVVLRVQRGATVDRGLVMRVTGARRSAAIIAGIVMLGGGVFLCTGGTHGEAAATTRRSHVLGPGIVTVKIRIDRSHFSPARVRVHPHTTVQFVVVNHDPIGHEFIIGDAEVHARHEGGHEASHPPVPGEVSIPPRSTGTTTFELHEPGVVEFACHLPGHFQYGMVGDVVVVDA